MPRKLTSRQARAMAAKRKTYAGGRPPVGPRCACGKMSAKRAAQMRHRCQEETDVQKNR